MMTTKLHEFSLLGGPLHVLGTKLGLVKGETSTTRLGLLLGFLMWGIMIALSLTDGTTSQFFSLSVIGVHVRLLIVIPMFFICETLVVPRMSAFVSLAIQSGLITKSSLPALNMELSRVSKWKNAWLPELIFLLIAAMLPLAEASFQPYGTSASFASEKVAELSMANQWYLVVSLTLFRFLMLRWLWHLGLWCFVLWRISRLELDLLSTHPDGSAGLGYLEVVQSHFTPLIFALSALQAAMLTEEISAHRMEFGAIYPPIMLVLIVDGVLFLGPLFIFSSKLWACKVKALSEYMEFSAQYVKDFDSKWLHNKTPAKEPLLGTPDLQSLADLNNSISVVRNMRWVPMSMPLLVTLLSAALVPMLPLLLLQYPITALAEKFFTNLIGL
jgi:hypothetical protein